jgi:hypothetical protein
MRLSPPHNSTINRFAMLGAIDAVGRAVIDA